jgi:Ca-activated chloride channel homolog
MPSHGPLRALVPFSLALVISCAPAGAQTPVPGTRTVYVSVVDTKGVPVPDLTATDFVVKEDGKTRPVLSAEVSKVPMAVALLLDDSGLGLQSIREGAAALVTKLRGAATISITTTAGRNFKLQDYTGSTATLMAALNRVFAKNVTGAYLMDALAGAANELRTREGMRPVIVSVGIEGDEFSSIRANDALSAIQRSGAQVYLVRLGAPVVGQTRLGERDRDSNADSAIQANSVFGQAPARSGGLIEQLSAVSGVQRVMEQIATELLGQYAVAYSSASLTAADLKFSVETSRKGVKLRAQNRVGPPR